MSMPSKFPKSYLALDEETPFLEPATSFGIVRAWLKHGKEDATATFDLLVREMPKIRNFLVFTGLEEMVQTILNWRYSEKYVKILEEWGYLDRSTKKFLKNFKFTGSLYAMPEGSVFFQGEPVVKIVAPIAQAALLYNFLVNALCTNTTFSSKCIRVRLAAEGKQLVTGAIRGHAMESMIKYMRGAYITGFDFMLAPVFSEKYGVRFPRPFKGMHHHFVKSFSSELESMSAIAKVFPNEANLILDTYDMKSGIENALRVCREMKKKKKGIGAVFIDSGDLAKWARYVRNRLDQAGFHKVRIMLASDLNEWKIRDLIRKKVPFDGCMLVTEPITSADAPILEAVYKVAQIEEEGIVRPTMKFSPKKMSLPGDKQVYRIFKDGKMQKDTIGLDKEYIAGKKLLVPIIKNGRLVYQLPTLETIRDYTAAQVTRLPEQLKSLAMYRYPVSISSGLKCLVRVVASEHL